MSAGTRRHRRQRVPAPPTATSRKTETEKAASGSAFTSAALRGAPGLFQDALGLGAEGTAVQRCSNNDQTVQRRHLDLRWGQAGYAPPTEKAEQPLRRRHQRQRKLGAPKFLGRQHEEVVAFRRVERER